MGMSDEEVRQHHRRMVEAAARAPIDEEHRLRVEAERREAAQRRIAESAAAREWSGHEARIRAAFEALLPLIREARESSDAIRDARVRERVSTGRDGPLPKMVRDWAWNLLEEADADGYGGCLLCQG
jgi:hypothetical protein